MIEALLCYVPAGDPRIMVVVQAGQIRRINSDDLETASKPLEEDFVGTQLRLVVQSLRELVEYLPL